MMGVGFRRQTAENDINELKKAVWSDIPSQE
jgi:hypothetical protein